ncbi:MAG: TetR/AcrR family transcriptional regulator [Campylobacteraceae bacterium]|nr:TetR/AcrR family transcriptional regulator [Campylobacteraceae bacterium]
MPRMVNKEERIDYICDEAYNAFVENGIDKFSLNRFITDINMSKGQFYHYFSTKEQLIYQVMSKKSFELMNKIKEKYEYEESFINKIHLIFEIYLNEDKAYADLRKLYINTLHMYITSEDKEIKEFNTNLYKTIFKYLEQLFDYEIQKGNFRPESKNLAKALCSTADGMFLLSVMIENYDLKTELSNYFSEIEKLSKKY